MSPSATRCSCPTCCPSNPHGARVELHRRAGGSTDNLRATWSSATFDRLCALAGTPAQGTWTLEVADVAAIDIGKPNHWGLVLQTDQAMMTIARANRSATRSKAARAPRRAAAKSAARERPAKRTAQRG